MKKTTTRMQKVGKKINNICLEEGEQLHMGIDDHKKSYHVALWSVQRDDLVTYWVQPASAESLKKKLLPFREHIVKMVYEAGPNGFTLARQMREVGLDVEVVSASHTPQSSVDKAKSDRLDCRALARYSSKGMLHKIYIPTLQEEADRQVGRLRDQMLENQRRFKQQIKSFLLVHGIAEPKGLSHWSRHALAELRKLKIQDELKFSLEVLLDELLHAELVVKRLTRKVKELSETERHKATVEALKTAPSVGLITTMTLVMELPRPERFQETTQVGKYMGFAPKIRSTGEIRHECGRESAGNRHLRTILIEAAWRWIGRDDWARHKYRQLLQNTRNAKKAITAMARRLGIILWRMMITKQTYIPKPVQTNQTNSVLPERDFSI